MRPIETIQDLIQEAKIRTVCWAVCVFAISYILTHTSESMWVNVPISVVILVAFRFLSYEVELHWKVQPVPKQTYLSQLEQKQLSLEDSRLAAVVPSSRWRKKIDSPLIEVAIEELIDKILQEFVMDLWYSSISPDKESPEIIRSLILDVLGEISGRVKEINLVDLLTRDLVDLIGNQLDLYRQKQSEIGVSVMATLSSEERDERLKHHLAASQQLHPALLSPESEYQVLQRIVGGILSIALKPHDSQCPLVHCFSRELLTCLILQPIMKFASPGYINELIADMILNNEDSSDMEVTSDMLNPDSGPNTQSGQLELRKTTSDVTSEVLDPTVMEVNGSNYEQSNFMEEESVHNILPRPAEWAMLLEAATKRRTEVLAPENLENMWTKGRNYRKKTMKAGSALGSVNTTSAGTISNVQTGSEGKEWVTNMSGSVKDKEQCRQMGHIFGNEKEVRRPTRSANTHLRRSRSTPNSSEKFVTKYGKCTSSKENHLMDVANHKLEPISEDVSHIEGSWHVPDIKCQIAGAYFEKLGSKSFAAYLIAVKAENETWFVRRRYRNFERLHQRLKVLPNYSLHLPPKRFLSSSVDDYFVQQRCVLLDKYLENLLSLANVAEHDEVWDFLSASSKNYSCGQCTSANKYLAVCGDDPVDDIVHQFKGISDGRVCGEIVSSPSHVISDPVDDKALPSFWNREEKNGKTTRFNNVENSHSFSDDEQHDTNQSNDVDSGWHSDNEIYSKESRSQRSQESNNFDNIGSDAPKTPVASDASEGVDGMPQEGEKTHGYYQLAIDEIIRTLRMYQKESLYLVDPDGVATLLAQCTLLPMLSGQKLGLRWRDYWVPPNVSLPLLDLVDKVFQLKRRGWLRRQVVWISKQILQLILEDAIDDWILRQIYWLRREDVIAQGIRLIQDILWPDGIFFTKPRSMQFDPDDHNIDQKPSHSTDKRSGEEVITPRSFKAQLEAIRRAEGVRKFLFSGAPTALVSLIGPSQYRRSARDIYYFLQSTICIKQLGYSMLEVVLLSIFPELRELLLDIHEKERKRPNLNTDN